MATYKDILLLVDKVSAPLKKIQENTRKATEKTNKFRAGLDKLTAKLRATATRLNALGTKVGAFSKKVAGAFAAITGTIALVGGAILRGANQVADLGDRIDKMSQKIGMGRKAFQEWDYIMSQNGGNVESLQMGFKTLTTQIEGVQKGSKDSMNAFKALGVSVKDTNGQFRTQDDIFNDTVRALQKIQDPTKKAILANRLFGRSAAELKPLLNQSADAIDELRSKANKRGLILSDEDIDNAVRYKDTMDTFSRFFQAKFANVIKSIVCVVNALKNVGGFIGTVLGQLLSIPTYISMAFNTLKTNITIGMITIGRAIASIADKIKAVFSGVVQTIIGWIQKIIEKKKI